MTVRAVDSQAADHDAELLTLQVAGSPAASEVAAHSEADQIRAEARRDAFLLYTSARQDAERLIDEARAEAAEIVEAAKAEAARLTSASRDAAEEAAARVLSVALSESGAVAAPEAPDDVTMDDEPRPTIVRDGRSRYSVRSAKLPRLGDDAGRAALHSVANLRESFGE
jgi:cell division septum initiation protein DivIVA